MGTRAGALPLRVGSDGTAQLLQQRSWRWDKHGRVSARIGLTVPGITIAIPSREVGAAIATRIQGLIRQRLQAGQDAANAGLPRIKPETWKRRFRRARQFSGAGAQHASWTATRAQQRKSGVSWRRDDRWLVDRFVGVSNRQLYAPDGGTLPGRESGYLADQMVVQFRGGRSGDARFGVYFPSLKRGAAGYYGRGAYIVWAEARGARIVTVPPDMDRELAEVLREFSGLMPDARRFRLRIAHLLRGLGVAENIARWAFGG